MLLIVKGLGIIFVLFFFTALGFNKAQKLKKQKDELKSVIECIEKIKNGIVYAGLEMNRILPDATEKISFINQKNECTEISENSLNLQDQTLLNEFFFSLGQCSKSEEKEKCEMYLTLFNLSYKKCEKEYEQKAKILLTAGICSGLGVAIMLI